MNAIEAVDYLAQRVDPASRINLEYEELLTTKSRAAWVTARAALEKLLPEERFTPETIGAFRAINVSRLERGLQPLQFYG